MNKSKFQPGSVVTCRDVGVGSALQLGATYLVKACAKIDQFWMVQIIGPAGFNIAGETVWYLERRFK